MAILEKFFHQVLSLGSLSKGKITKIEDPQQLQQQQHNKDNTTTTSTKDKDKKLELYKNISPPPNLKRKTLILDLDETLVHSTIKTVTHHHITVDVMIDGLTCTFYVIKRPHVDIFLKKVPYSPSPFLSLSRPPPHHHLTYPSPSSMLLLLSSHPPSFSSHFHLLFPSSLPSLLSSFPSRRLSLSIISPLSYNYCVDASNDK
jgi:hypothetical protein